jgi:hypothetical protein
MSNTLNKKIPGSGESKNKLFFIGGGEKIKGKAKNAIQQRLCTKTCRLLFFV